MEGSAWHPVGAYVSAAKIWGFSPRAADVTWPGLQFLCPCWPCRGHGWEGAAADAGFPLGSCCFLVKSPGRETLFWGTPLSFLSNGEHTLLSTERMRRNRSRFSVHPGGGSGVEKRVGRELFWRRNGEGSW